MQIRSDKSLKLVYAQHLHPLFLLGQETLLHLSARLGFTQLATYLLDQPGSPEALQTQDKSGKVPEDIARERGMKLLADMFSRYGWFLT